MLIHLVFASVKASRKATLNLKCLRGVKLGGALQRRREPQAKGKHNVKVKALSKVEAQVKSKVAVKVTVCISVKLEFQRSFNNRIKAPNNILIYR